MPINFKNKIWLFILPLMLLFLLPDAANANAKTTLTTIFKNSEDAWKSITIFLGAVIFVTGVILGGVAITKFKSVADGKATMTQPIIFTVISAALIASPSVVMTLSDTFYSKVVWQPTELLTKIPTGGNMAPGVSEALTSVLVFIQMLGVIAFFRGMLMFKAIGSGKDGQFGKAMTHVIGGVLAINIQLTVGILARTFFTGSDLPLGMENW